MKQKRWFAAVLFETHVGREEVAAEFRPIKSGSFEKTVDRLNKEARAMSNDDGYLGTIFRYEVIGSSEGYKTKEECSDVLEECRHRR